MTTTSILAALGLAFAVASAIAYAIAKWKMENGKCRIAESSSLERKEPIHHFTFYILHSQLTSALSIDGFSHGTNAVSISLSWVTNFSPARAWLEIYGKEFSLTNAWEPRMSMQTQPGETNATISVATTNPPMAFYTARFDTLRIDAPGCQSYVREDGSRLFVSTTGALAQPVAVSRPDRSPSYPAPDPAFAADPFSGVDGLAYDPANSTVTASDYGSYDLPDGGTLFMVKSPVLTFGVSHSYPGRSTVYDPVSGGYSLKSPYPLDSRALWRSFRRGTSPLTGCSCVPEVDYGGGLVVRDGGSPARSVGGFPEGVHTRFTPEEGGVRAELLYGTNVIWSGWCAHDRSPEEDEKEREHEYYRDDESGEGGCECGCGDVDALESSSRGSIRFRIPLGSPQSEEISGFLYVDRDDVFMPDVSVFQVLARDDAHVEDSTSDGVRTVACFGNRGRTLVLSMTWDDVLEIDVRDTSSGAFLHKWQVDGDGTYVRFTKISRLNNTMWDKSYSFDSGAWHETDLVSGREDTCETTYPGTDVYMREDLKTFLGGTLSRRVVSEYALLGSGSGALLRRTGRRELSADGAWKERTSSYWNDAAHVKRHGRTRMESGDDVRWSWRAYDNEGRETFRLEQRDGSQPPADAADWSIVNLPTATAAFATLFDYEPLTGDSARSNDWGKVRTESRYVVAGGAATLAGRTWTVYEHGVTNLHPVVTATRIRACRADALIDDPGNEVTVEARYDDRSGEVPYTLRGETVRSVDAAGVTTLYGRTVSGEIVRTVVRRFCGTAESPTRRAEERDLAYGNLLYEAESPTSDPTVEFGRKTHIYDEKNRLRSTTYDDGTFETNAYSCCRLLWSQNRDGAKRIRYAQTGTDHLYHAYVDTEVSGLPKEDAFYYGPWGGGTFKGFAPVAQHWFDGLGRETNTTVRTGKIETDETLGEILRLPSYKGGLSASSSTSYPQGVSDVSETVGYRGLRTLKRGLPSQLAEKTVEEEFEPGETTPSVVATNVAIRGGGMVAWRGDSDKWSCRHRFSGYATDGCRVDYDVTESSDNVVVTNSVVEHDFLERVTRRTTPTSSVVNFYDGASSRVASTIDEISGVAATNLYDDVGEPVGAVSGGVASMHLTDYECASGAWWKVEASFAEAGGVTNRVRTTRTRLTGLSDALRSEVVESVDGVVESHAVSAYDAEANTVRTTVTNATAGVSWTVSKFGYPIEEGFPTCVVENKYGPTGKVFVRKRRIAGGESVIFDESEVDALGAEICRTVCDRYWLDKSPCFEYAYDCRGNRCVVSNAVGSMAFTLHDADGNAVAESGATYPTESDYDTADRRVALRTTRNGTSWDETTWGYDPAKGVCTNKTYADGSAVSYTHTPDGLSLRTTYASGRWRENAYDSNRRLVGVTHSDPSLDYAVLRDVFGRVTNVVDAADREWRYEYGRGDTVVREEMVGCDVPAAPQTTNALVRSFDPFARTTGYSLSVDGIQKGGVGYAYGEDGRLSRVFATNAAGRVFSVAYTNLAGFSHGYAITTPGGDEIRRTISRDVYRRELATGISTKFNGATLDAYSYSYDALSRPTLRNADTFGYNERSEVVSAQIGTNSFAHAYDFIGNQTNFVANAETNTFTHNALNQLETATVPQFSILNSTFSISHDLDGNMTSDGVFTYTYDSENRLASVSSNGIALVANEYDYRGRRIRKTTPTTETTFVYDGWNLIHETISTISGTTTNTTEIQFFWGTDLSETLQGAGGVGGLLAVSINGDFYFPAMDNNGNATKYIDENGNIVAEYTYNAFGKTISQSGLMADFFRHRFSTKYYDDETGLYYYGYRFYSPTLMRWLNRDPIDEAGGLNLYEFCGNCSICFYDALGNLVITGAYPSQDKSPSILDQLGFMPLPHGEEKWFERNYAGWLAEARRRFSVEIERGIDCKSTSFNGPSIRINIEPSENRRGSTSSRTPGGNERKYGDAGQSDWSADKVLGCFSIDYVTPVKITYTNMGGGKRRYSWSTEMYIYDVLGTQDHDPIRKIPVVGDIIGSLTPSRGVKRATWTLSGSGECDCCRGK